ncbi:hypothetical protein CY35_01G032800 [Sphagnum magellanicum]|nr:hypothetical protein CY35_01G032800 [Sphagnum magellanicum]
MILERGKYYHMNPKPDYEPHSNNLRMRILFAKCWEIMQGNYNGNEVDASILDKWMQPNVPTQTGSWECGWFVLKYFDMYIQQRFVATEMEFEQVQFTEDWFAYDDAIAMRTWLEEAIRTELFGPTFENSGPWQLMKLSRGWIAPQVSRLVSEESEQSSALMYDNHPRIGESPHSRQSNSATEHIDTHKGVQEGTITPNTDGSPARSKNEKQLEMEGRRDFIQECAIEDEEWKWSPVYLLLRDFSSLSAYLPRPWKHTAEEWGLIHKYIGRFFLYKCSVDRIYIVVALQCTWKLHFSENITDVDLNTLSQRLEHVSQEKEFVSNLSRVQDLMRGQWNDMPIVSQKDLVWEETSELSIRNSRKQQILANDIAFFKAPSETPGHQDVMKRVCKNLSEIAGHAMAVHLNDPEKLEDMWIRGCPKNKQEMLIKKWKSIFYDTLCHFYANNHVTLS